jgi:hypothetical protein
MPENACFVIGPIGDENTPTRNNADTLLRYVIKRGLEPKYRVTRADEISAPGMINDQVITSIQTADLIVADLHGENPNAYYEVAIAHCFRKPTIHMIAKGAKIPFDLHEYRTIHYDLANPEAHDRARKDLQSHVEALEAPDAVISNPVTRALGTFELEQSGDARDRWVAELGVSIQRLTADMQRVKVDINGLLQGVDWFVSSMLAGRQLDLPMPGSSLPTGSPFRAFMSQFEQEPSTLYAEKLDTTNRGQKPPDE